jgi:hypothetical protein
MGMGMNEVFNKVSAHLLKQNAKSVAFDNACMYKSWLGLSCAVGCLIDDEHYNSEFEEEGCDNPLVVDALAKSGVDVTGNTIGLLHSLQTCHDDYEVHEWEAELMRIARWYDVTPN